MKAPDKIYVPQHNIEAGNIQELDELIVAGSTEYIRKDALMEWAKGQYERLMDGFRKEVFGLAELNMAEAYKQVIDKIESL